MSLTHTTDMDTWHPAKYPSAWSSEQTKLTHGSMFWLAQVAYDPPLILPNSSVHAGLRSRLSGDDYEDYQEDTAQGWFRIESDEIDDIGVKGVVDKILQNLSKDVPIYLSVDIDVIDPGICPVSSILDPDTSSCAITYIQQLNSNMCMWPQGTGTPEPGGWTTREMIRILRSLEGLNVVGADIVEVAPAYDGTGEQTALAAAQIAYEIITSIVKRGVESEKAKMRDASGTRHWVLNRVQSVKAHSGLTRTGQNNERVAKAKDEL